MERACGRFLTLSPVFSRFSGVELIDAPRMSLTRKMQEIRDFMVANLE